MNKRAIWAIARKDIASIFANSQVWLPMVIVPLIFTVILPAGLCLGLTYFPLGSEAKIQDTLNWVTRAAGTGAIGAAVAAYPAVAQKVVYLAINYLFAPLFLVIPIMTAGTVASDSFAGEKERGTLETLLFSPASLLSLFAGKVLASFLPSMLLSLVSFLLFGLTANLAGFKLMGGLFFPQLNWLPLMLLVIPGVSLLNTLLTVFVSARVSSFQAAYQMSGMLVLPVILLIFGQVSGFLLLQTWVIAVIGAVLAVLDWFLLRRLSRSLDRGYLFESQIR